MKNYLIPLFLFSVMATSFGNISITMAESVEHKITQAQPELAKQPLTIITKNGLKRKFLIEIAQTPTEQEVGEMFRTSIPDNGGMLFIWSTPQLSYMWMKNTVVPLDMVFIDTHHRIKAIAKNTTPYDLTPISSGGAVIATLELKGGITEKLGIAIGDKVSSPAFDVPQTTSKKNKILHK